MGSVTGVAAGLPRRLTICTVNSPAPGSSARRRQAGEGSRAASRGRKSSTQARLASASEMLDKAFTQLREGL